MKNKNIIEIDHIDSGAIVGSTSNLHTILEMLRDFREWQREWDTPFGSNRISVDEFAELLSRKYKVERIAPDKAKN